MMESRLTLIKYLEPKITGKTKKKKRYGLYQCSCGNIKEILRISVTTGKTNSCGCLKKEQMTTHGLTNHKLHSVWHSIKQRCLNKNATGYNSYGGRGITICDEWSSDFMSFYNWAISNGWSDGLQVDRINNDGNYEPNNCRFVTPAKNCEVGRQRKPNNNKSGWVGIGWDKKSNKWKSRLSYIELGRFKTIEEAIEARIKKEIEIYGEQRTNLEYKC